MTITHAAIDGCIWMCEKAAINAHTTQLQELFDISFDVSVGGSATLCSSSTAGLHLIAVDETADPGMWGIILAVDDTVGALERLSSNTDVVESHPADEVLAKQGLVCAGSFLGVRLYLRDAPCPSVFDLPDGPRRTRPYLYIFTWVVGPESLDRIVAELSNALRADFDTCEFPGARITMSWDSGLELIAPEPRELRKINGELDGTTTDVHYDHLLHYGDSPWSIVLRVDDLAAFRSHAADLGYRLSGVKPGHADAAEEQRWFQTWTRKVIANDEIRLPPFLGIRIMAGQATFTSEQNQTTP
jgi:hypothetical protein